MIERVLEEKKYTKKTKITVKSLISIALIALAVLLPQLVHLVAGSKGGGTWLPMYLPVLLGGCFLGVKWGLGIGLLAPVCSFLLTSIDGNAMPAITRLPYMMAELTILAVVSGSFGKKIARRAEWAFAAVLCGYAASRLGFLLLAFLFESMGSLTVVTAISQVQNGLWGVSVQLVVVPLIVIGAASFLKERKE